MRHHGSNGMTHPKLVGGHPNVPQFGFQKTKEGGGVDC